eukprot:Skav231940  [mRNA]  locus=scaffold3596:6634:12324:+ [translate_table: standard]
MFRGKAFWEPSQIRQALGTDANIPEGARVITPLIQRDTPSTLTEPCLTALELMKFGQLTGEPFETADETKPFPQEIKCRGATGGRALGKAPGEVAQVVVEW